LTPNRPKAANMNRQKSLKVRLTDAEYAQLKQQADGRPMASYLRSLCLGSTAMPSNTQTSVNPQLLRQLAGIGNNTNQIARRVNQHLAQGGELTRDDVQILEQLFQSISDELVAIRQQHTAVN